MISFLPRAGALRVLAFLLCALAPLAYAVPLRVESSGSFSATTPVTSFSAPGASWSLSFIVDQQPALSPDHDMVREDINTTPIFRDFSYRLDGVAGPVASYAVLWSEEIGGGMDLIFGTIPIGTPYGYDALIFVADRSYYSGSESAPTILAGSYPTTYPPESGLYVAHLGVFHEQPATVLTISAVPLPPSAAMMLGGLLGLAAWRRGAWRKR